MHACLHHAGISSELRAIILSYAFKPIAQGGEPIKLAVELWFRNKYQALLEYGHMSGWDTSAVTDMDRLFMHIDGRQQIPDITHWDTSNVTSMKFMFLGCKTFHQPIGQWDVSNVTNMMGMFNDCESFNQPLDNWNVSAVTNMGQMFSGAKAFNQSLASWDVSHVATMSSTFCQAEAFNHPLNDWIVDNVTTMHAMFQRASSFNQPLNKWNVHNVMNFFNMFDGATCFNQSLDGWGGFADGRSSTGLLGRGKLFSRPTISLTVASPLTRDSTTHDVTKQYTTQQSYIDPSFDPID